MRKYIFVTGGAVSDASKTVVASSLGLMLASRGFKVINKKLSPYINITLDGLDPQKYGETFLLENGAKHPTKVSFRALSNQDTNFYLRQLDICKRAYLARRK